MIVPAIHWMLVAHAVVRLPSIPVRRQRLLAGQQPMGHTPVGGNVQELDPHAFVFPMDLAQLPSIRLLIVPSLIMAMLQARIIVTPLASSLIPIVTARTAPPRIAAHNAQVCLVLITINKHVPMAAGGHV